MPRERVSPPLLPAIVHLSTHPNARDERAAYFTVSSRNHQEDYRVRASIEPQDPGAVLFVATSLGDVESTLHRLILIELVATLAVLGALVGLGLWVVQLGLRPLRRIEETAAAITAGDLSRRVERADSQTEVGRVGAALNAMLDQIETSDKRCAASSPTRHTSCGRR